MKNYKNISVLSAGKRVTFFLLVLSGTFFVSSCQQSQPADAVVKIGVIAYLQGDLVETEGNPTLYAAQLAVRDLESSGGLVVNDQKKKIKLVIESIEQSKEASVAATRKLINRDGVVAIVGPQYSSDAIPSGGVAEQSGVPTICPVSTNPKTTKGRNYVFRMSFLDPAQGSAMATTALEDLHALKAAVLYDESDDYSRGIATVFRDVFSEKGDVVAFEGYVPGDGDMADKMQRIKKVQPDVLYLPNYHNQVVSQVRLALENGIETIFLGADGWDQRVVPTLADFDNSFFSVHWSTILQSEQARTFTENYQKEFKSLPNGTAAVTYDAFHLIFKAVAQQQKTDPASIRNGLLEIGPYAGVGGEIDFIDSGDPKKEVLILHVKDGKPMFFKYTKQ